MPISIGLLGYQRIGVYMYILPVLEILCVYCKVCYTEFLYSEQKKIYIMGRRNTLEKNSAIKRKIPSRKKGRKKKGKEKKRTKKKRKKEGGEKKKEGLAASYPSWTVRDPGALDRRLYWESQAANPLPSHEPFGCGIKGTGFLAY